MTPPRATNQVSLYQRGYLVTRMPHVEPVDLDECVAVLVVDLAIEVARYKSLQHHTNTRL